MLPARHPDPKFPYRVEAETPTPPPGACTSDAYRQFDFWIGDWTVSSNGQPAGSNSVVPVHGGCGLQENWSGRGGQYQGTSYNFYDRVSGNWHQTWVDSSGTLLELNGGLQDGSMVLEGTRPGQDGGPVQNRITWTPNEDGSVRQHWQARREGDAEWSTLFDGLYVKAAGAQ